MGLGDGHIDESLSSNKEGGHFTNDLISRNRTKAVVLNETTVPITTVRDVMQNQPWYCNSYLLKKGP